MSSRGVRMPLMWPHPPPLRRPDLLDRLARLGAPHLGDSRGEYVGSLGLAPADVPDLVAIAQLWIRAAEGFPDGDAVYAPVHAWRALGQLAAAECVAPLLGMMNVLEAEDDDWYLEDFARVLGRVGAPALEPTIAYLRDPRNRLWPRCCAAGALGELGSRHPELRDRAVAALAAQLEAAGESPRDLNGQVVLALMDLRAVEVAEPIERAYAAGHVDPSVADPWSEVRDALGVPGLGLVEDEEWLEPDGGTIVPRAAVRTKDRAAAKAKRQRAKESRRRNRGR